MVTGSRLDKVAEKGFLLFCMHRFRMPLDTQHKIFFRHFHGFGQAVGAAGTGVETLSQKRYRLMVQGIDGDFRGSPEFFQLTAGKYGNAVGGVGTGCLLAVLEGSARLYLNILNKYRRLRRCS